jgi:ribosomal-protein-serine acetyltransferase
VLRHDLPSGAHLRLFEEADAGELFALTDRNRAHLEPWLPWVPATRSAEDSLGFIRLTRQKLADNDGLSLAIVRDGAIVGTAGFHAVDWANRVTTIGYWLAADAQGRGTMTEAVRALVDHAFGGWGLERLEILAAVDNARSRAIPERLGFVREGVKRRAQVVGDRVLDLVVYAMLAGDWPRPGRPGRNH